MMTSGLPEYEHQIHGYKKRKLKDLSLDEKIGVVEDIIFKKDYHDNVCSRYEISRESIKSLLRKWKKDPTFLRKDYQVMR